MKKIASVMAITAFFAFGGACAEDQPKTEDQNLAEQPAVDQADGITGASSSKENHCKGKEHCPPPHWGNRRGHEGMPPKGHHPGMMPQMGPMPGMMPPVMGQQPMLMGPVMYRTNGYVIIIMPDQGFQQMPGMMPQPAWNQHGMMPPPGAKFGPRQHGSKHCFKFNPDTGEKNPDCKDGERKRDGKGPHGPKPEEKK